MNEIDLKKRIDEMTGKISSSLTSFGGILFTTISQDVKCLSGEADAKTQEMITKMLDAINKYINGEIEEEGVSTLVSRYKQAAVNYAEAKKIQEMIAVANRIDNILGTVIDIIRIIVVK